MRPLLSLLAALLCLNADAQNLIPNGSFESYNICPTSFGGTSSIHSWNSYTSATPDYFNSCASSTVGVPTNAAGYQPAASGSAYIGLLTLGSTFLPDYREYVRSQLLSALIPGVYYELSLSVSLSDYSAVGADGMAAFFCENCAGTSYPTTSTTILPYTPQVSFSGYGPITDQTNWIRLTKTFLADSAYVDIILGSFTSDASTNTLPVSGAGSGGGGFYLIDSVVLHPIDSLTINLTATNYCAGQSVNIPYIVNAVNYFNSGNVFTVELSDASGSFASPTSIGTVNSYNSGTIPCLIPSTANGTGYRMRIKSTSPAYTSQIYGIDLSIVQPPTVNASSNSPICENSDLELYSSSISNATYFWSGPNGFYDFSQNSTFNNPTVSDNGNYVITVTAGPCIVYDTVDVTINPIPYPTAGSNTPVCPGTTFQLNATSLPGATYSWIGPGGFTSNIANPSWSSAVYTNAGTYEVTASLNGCTATAQTTVAVQITTATPIASSAAIMCEEFPLNITATTSTLNATYTWTGPAGYTSNQQSPNDPAKYTYNNQDFIVKATVNGCVSLPDTVTVQVYPKPYLGNYASPNDTVCENTVVTFVTVPMNGVTNPVFQWFKNGAAVPGATALTLVSPDTTGDTFYCRTYCQNQCGDNLTLYSNKVGMAVLPIVTDLSVAITSVPAIAQPGVPVTFHANTTGGGYTPQYQWKKNGNDIWGATSAIYNANNLAPYDRISVCVISSDPCANPTNTCSDAVVVNFPTSIGNVPGGDGISIYPNPNTGEFTLKSQRSKVKTIELVNVSGQVVYTLQPGQAQAEYTITLPQQLPSGVFAVRIHTGDASPVIKQLTVTK